MFWQTTIINHACAIGLVNFEGPERVSRRTDCGRRCHYSQAECRQADMGQLYWPDVGVWLQTGQTCQFTPPQSSCRSGIWRAARGSLSIRPLQQRHEALQRTAAWCPERSSNGTSDPQIGWQTDTRPCRPNNQPSSVIGVSTELTAGFRKGTNACGAFKSNPSSGSMWPQCFDRTCSTVRSA